MEALKVEFTTFNQRSVDCELERISKWWQEKTIDTKNGGYYGELDYFAKPIKNATKSCVLNTRILWFFSELAGRKGCPEALSHANRTFKWILSHMLDNEYGGLFWSADHNGIVSDSKKQTYAQSFGIYALSSYYHLTGDPQVLTIAMQLFELLEQHARDKVSGGYIEACNRQWELEADFRLSEKDLNCPKSMNTHLHVLEAYTALYKINPTPDVEKAFRHVIDIFIRHIVCHETHHLKLFFDMNWNDKSQTVSYGHDIEASWLLWEAASILQDDNVKQEIHQICLSMVDVCAVEAIGPYGQVCDDYNLGNGLIDEKSYWWVQAEALVGFMNAYVLTSDPKYFSICSQLWEFIQAQHIDHKNGEWHWLALRDQDMKQPIYKAGFWKAPYHNGRAMMELNKMFAQSGAN